MEQRRISLRQYLVLMTVALLPPVVKIVPGKLVDLAGRGGWIVPALAIVPVLLAVWFIGSLRLPEGSGLRELLCLAFGKCVGRILCGIYGLWLLLLACCFLRFCADRFTSTIYPDSGMGIFFVVILALVWYLVRRELAVMARAAQIFFFVVVFTVSVVLALAVGSVRSYNVLPVWTQDAPGMVLAAWPVAGALSVGVSGLFFFGQVGERRDGVRLSAVWLSCLCLAASVVGFVVMGMFGPVLSSHLSIPFFSLAKEVSLGIAAERVEPMVVAMWVFADVILLSMLLHGAQSAFGIAVGQPQHSLATAMVLVILPGAYLVAASSFGLEMGYDRWLLPGEGMLFCAVPVVAGVVGKLRKAV